MPQAARKQWHLAGRERYKHVHHALCFNSILGWLILCMCRLAYCICGWCLPKENKYILKTQTLTDVFTCFPSVANLLWPRMLCVMHQKGAASSNGSLWMCKHHPFSITFHNSEDRVPPLPSSTKQLLRKINYVLKLVSQKTQKSWPFKAIAAFVVARRAIRCSLYC